jgi:flavin-binding protein dodecin
MEESMAKQQRKKISASDASIAEPGTDTVYKIVDVVGVSTESWEDAGRNAVETAAGSLRDLRVAEVTKMDMKVENGKVAALSVIECFETDGGVNYRSDRLILF